MQRSEDAVAEKIEPALSAEDIEAINSLGAINHVGGVVEFIGRAAFAGAWHKVIAVAHRELPDSDPRKITRERIEEIRYGAMFARGMAQQFLDAGDELVAGNRAEIAANLDGIADALESYLPPEGT